jgi:hypothetical protein
MSVASEVFHFAVLRGCDAGFDPILGAISCDGSSCGFRCATGPGHEGSGWLRRYESAAAAATAFEMIADGPKVDYHGFVASFWSRDYPGLPFVDDEHRHGVLHANCWVVYSESFDDTAFRYAPQPDEVIADMYAKGLELALFDLCPDP